VVRTYLASTPYHLLLSLALQERDGRPDAALIFSDEARILQRAPELGVLLGETFDVRSVPPLSGSSRILDPARARRSSVATLDALRSLGGTESLWVFNGQTPPALAAGRHYGDSLRFEYVEDGLDAYLPVNLHQVKPLRRRLHAISFGSSHPHLIDMTAALPFSGWHVLFPDFCRLDVGLDRITPIPADALVNAIGRAATAVPQSGVPESITDLHLLGRTTPTHGAHSGIEAMRAWADSVRDRYPGASLAVKAHPLESDRATLKALEDVDDLQVLPSWVPSELLTSLLAPEVRIRCDLTTFIVTSRVLLPGRTVELESTVAAESARALLEWDPQIYEAEPTGR